MPKNYSALSKLKLFQVLRYAMTMVRFLRSAIYLIYGTDGFATEACSNVDPEMQESCDQRCKVHLSLKENQQCRIPASKCELS